MRRGRVQSHMKRLTQSLALLLFGLLAAACNMSISEFMDARQGASQPGNVLVAGPQAQFIYSHADW